MNDLIYKQAAIDAAVEAADEWDGGCNPEREKAIRTVIMALPAVDAVPVVRCGECKHLMADGRCFAFADDNIRPSVSDYCSHGERREE